MKRSDRMKTIAWGLGVLIPLWPALMICAQLAGRTALWFAYGMTPYKNHVGDEYFAEISADTMAAISWMVIAVILAFVSQRRSLFYPAILAGVMCLLTPIIFEAYHRNHILVTYDEFASHTVGRLLP